MPFITADVTDERDAHIVFLTQQLDQLRICALGLDDDQLRATPTVSSLSIAGLITHVTQSVTNWLRHIYLHGVRSGSTGLSDKDFTLAFQGSYWGAQVPDLPGDRLRSELQNVVELARSVLVAADFEARVPIPEAPWFPQDLGSWNVRWIAHHLNGEVARHCGHADIIRESLDGEIAYSLNAQDAGEEFNWDDYTA